MLWKKKKTVHVRKDVVNYDSAKQFNDVFP